MRRAIAGISAVALFTLAMDASSDWCSDFDRRVRHGDPGLIYDNEANGWGAIYDYLDAEDREGTLQRYLLGKPRLHPNRKLIYEKWAELCLAEERASDATLSKAMKQLVPRLASQANAAPPEPDMTAKPSLSVTPKGEGFMIQSSRPLTDAELVSYTRALAYQYGRKVIRGAIFHYGDWRRKTKLYPDHSVRVSGGASNKIYR